MNTIECKQEWKRIESAFGDYFYGFGVLFMWDWAGLTVGKGLWGCCCIEDWDEWAYALLAETADLRERIG